MASIRQDMVGQYIRGYDGNFYVVARYDESTRSFIVHQVDEGSARLVDDKSRLEMDLTPSGVEKCLMPSAINSTYKHIHKWHGFWMALHNAG